MKLFEVNFSLSGYLLIMRLKCDCIKKEGRNPKKDNNLPKLPKRLKGDHRSLKSFMPCALNILIIKLGAWWRCQSIDGANGLFKPNIPQKLLREQSVTIIDPPLANILHILLISLL